jgi:PII-like signaling protein
MARIIAYARAARVGRKLPRPAEDAVTGYQLTFFTVQGHRHKGRPIGDWLVNIAKEMGLTGATLIPGTEGFGYHRRIHSVHFIELTDQPIEIVMIVTGEEADRLFERLDREGVQLFYAKVPAEFGTIGNK